MKRKDREFEKSNLPDQKKRRLNDQPAQNTPPAEDIKMGKVLWEQKQKVLEMEAIDKNLEKSKEKMEDEVEEPKVKEMVFKSEIILHPELMKALGVIRKERGFVAKTWIEEKAKMLNNFMKRAGLKACCVNCSGGIDSSVTIGLIHHASKMEGSTIQKIVGIMQPIHSTASIQNRALKLEKMCELITVDQSGVFDTLAPLVEKSVGIEEKKMNDEELRFQRGQLKSYMRTPVAYYVAQLIGSQGLPCIVVGTGNFDEDGYLYYFCKAGDGIADIQLINELHKSEVYEVGAELGLHDVILKSAPSADLWPGQTDENELGFSYDFVELYTEYINLPRERREGIRNGFSEDALKEFLRLEKMIQSVHRRNKHKENYPYNINVKKFELKKVIHD